jgi:hypothetical protein
VLYILVTEREAFWLACMTVSVELLLSDCEVAGFGLDVCDSSTGDVLGRLSERSHTIPDYIHTAFAVCFERLSMWKGDCTAPWTTSYTGRGPPSRSCLWTHRDLERGRSYSNITHSDHFQPAGVRVTFNMVILCVGRAIQPLLIEYARR